MIKTIYGNRPSKISNDSINKCRLQHNVLGLTKKLKDEIENLSKNPIQKKKKKTRELIWVQSGFLLKEHIQ